MNENLRRRIEEYCTIPEVRDALGFSGRVSASFLAQGEYNINYEVMDEGDAWRARKHLVFRLNTASQLELDNQIRYEYDALRSLASSGVTPKPAYVDDTRSYFRHGILFMEYLNGRPLDYGRDLGHAARLFACVHGMDTRNFEDFMIKERGLCRARVAEGRRWLTDYVECPQASPETLGIFEKLVGYCDMEADKSDIYFENDPWIVVNNTEVNSHNFIIGESSQYIIDWEKPVLSDPVQDITQFLAPTTTLWRSDYLLSDEEIDHFYSMYGKFSSRDSADLRSRVDVYRPFLYLRALSWCAGAWVAYRGAERAINNPHTFEKIKQYLDPGFMKNLLRKYL